MKFDECIIKIKKAFLISETVTLLHRLDFREKATSVLGFQYPFQQSVSIVTCNYAKIQHVTENIVHLINSLHLELNCKELIRCPKQ